MADIEALFGEAERLPFDHQGDALASIGEITAAINRELQENDAQPGSDAVPLISGDWGDRIRKWLARLYNLVKDVAEKFGALSFSVNIGFPTGVSVSLVWSA